MTSTFKVGETYQMRNGEQVKVIDVDPSLFAHRVIAVRHASGFVDVRHADGRVYSDTESISDLMPPKRVVWVNFYSNYAYHYKTEADARERASGAIAVAVRVELP